MYLASTLIYIKNAFPIAKNSVFDRQNDDRRTQNNVLDRRVFLRSGKEYFCDRKRSLV